MGSERHCGCKAIIDSLIRDGLWPVSPPTCAGLPAPDPLAEALEGARAANRTPIRMTVRYDGRVTVDIPGELEEFASLDECARWLRGLGEGG